MNNLEFAEFKKKYGYGKEEKINKKKNTYNNNTKSEMFTLSDWAKKSEHYIHNHVWDCGKGDFIKVNKLEREMNKNK